MGDWDGEVVSYSAQGLAPDRDPQATDTATRFTDRLATRHKMREFIRNFRLGPQFPYRDQVRLKGFFS